MTHTHSPDPDAPSARRVVAARMAVAAAELLDAISDSRRSDLHWEFPGSAERNRWFYTPTDHGGLPLASMSSAEQRLAHRLMATGLSTAGYVTASTIIGLENVLDQLEGFAASWGRPRGRDPLMYYVRVFGNPSNDGDWGWRIGGHHVSLNFTVVNGSISGTTPLFLGADPASAPLLGPHPLRPLAGVEDLARELVRSFGTAQQSKAVVSQRAPTDLVLANRVVISEGDGPLGLSEIWRGRLAPEYHALTERIQAAADAATGLTVDDIAALSWSQTPKGLAASAMTAEQQALLETLLCRYVDRLPDELADIERQKFSGERLHDVHVLWAGGSEPGQPHYYRLHGPDLLAEYDNSARGANHVHTVWRDPRGDFGGDELAHHIATHPHHH
jgi:hypothetical protein